MPHRQTDKRTYSATQFEFMLSHAIISGLLPKLGIINFDRSDTIDKYFSSGLSQTILEASP